MPLPVKLQASILSWVGEKPPTEPMPNEEEAAVAAAAEAACSARYEEQSGGLRCATSLSCLSAADLFLLSNAAAEAGSPCVVVKDDFLGQQEASRVYQGWLYRTHVHRCCLVAISSTQCTLLCHRQY